MIQALFTNRWFLYLFCTASVFAAMFGVKFLFVKKTAKIQNEKVRTSVNLVIGVVLSSLISAIEMWLLCDYFGGTFYWKFVFAAALTATGLYLGYEKVFKNADFTAIGKVVSDVLSHSTLFNGNVSKKGLVVFKEQLASVVKDIDSKESSKEDKAVEEAVAKFSAFLADGKVSEEEKAQAEKLLTEHEALKNNPTVAKYYELLNRK